MAATTWGDVTFRNTLFTNVSITRTPAELRREDGGLSDQSEYVVRIAKHRISIEPKSGEIMVIDAKNWIIAHVDGKLAWQQEWVLTCGQRN